ncbi:MAG: DUF3418 domain-containing protein, partial [Micromonosporaceae bacterium]
ANPGRDRERMQEIQELRAEHQALLEAARDTPWLDAAREIKWMIEELRVSYFAQELKTAYPISAKRVWRAIDDLFAEVE